MKKAFVLFVLFALPITAYLFFSSGVNHFAKLPVLTENVKDFDAGFVSLKAENKVQLKDKISVLLYFGNQVENKEGNAFNINEEIYDKNYLFEDFQFVVVAEKGQEQAAQNLLDELSTTIDTQKWNFVFTTPMQIQIHFESLKTNLQLKNGATTHAFIIDKNRNLRGRTGEEDKSIIENYGYDTSSVAELSNVMTDDIKVILAEYRLALKKYNKEK
ncbi:hypothetical protein [Mesonia sp. K7]|uniref:hypothetical protein n=1 Tax=Mesonia sp. K7 TaxID=2218606 RepID=UPI000DA9E831|nr:hypothetical protein [Mesonia sp. K7]PZD78755.1 hypothetical protein DNG35_04705 [Mesonia sp. K7]